MKVNFIDSSSLDKKLNKLFKNKDVKNTVSGKFDIENIDLNEKSLFIINFILSIRVKNHITYKILFWEKDDMLKEFMRFNFPNKNFNIKKTYRNGKIPGILFIDDFELDEYFLKSLLDNHFNYEMAKNPSLNLRVQICINQENFVVLLDIYDDRGFNIYYIGR